VSRAKGNAAPAWVAEFLQPWWPGCEKTPNSRPGRDLLGTPGAAIEIKTGAEWRQKWVQQAAGYVLPGEVGLLFYIPPGVGRAAVLAGEFLAVLPVRDLMPLVVAAGYAPEPK
jgi:hypothetical protein